MRRERISFRAGELKLEGELLLPDSDPRGGVILCHPHPLYGGDMDNNVIVSLAEALPEKGILTMRFNFRGVGRSEGSFGGGVGERDDLRGAIDFVEGRVKNIGVFGYSFGASVALSALEDERVKAISCASPLLDSVKGIRKASKPLLFVSGERDMFVDRGELEREGRRIGASVVIIKSADHFWWGFEEELVRTVSDFFSENL